MSDYNRQLQRTIKDYQEQKQSWPATTTEMAEWALANGRFNFRAPALLRILAKDLAQAMREDYITDKKGRRVRAKHPAPSKRSGQTIMLWDDIRTAPREHMMASFQTRRYHIVSECRQVKLDVDSYNDAHPENQPIQMVLDFTKDVEELELESTPESEQVYELAQAA